MRIGISKVCLYLKTVSIKFKKRILFRVVIIGKQLNNKKTILMKLIDKWFCEKRHFVKQFSFGLKTKVERGKCAFLSIKSKVLFKLNRGLVHTFAL